MHVRKIEIVPYDSNWPLIYKEESSKLLDALSTLSFTSFHHIGSTSIPDLAAKPVIDILGEVLFIEELDFHATSLVALGYLEKGESGIPRRRFFSKPASQLQIAVNLHFFEKGSFQVQRHLAFRNYLQTHPSLATEYGLLKTQLAKQYPNDIESYLKAKSSFIQKIDCLAYANYQQKCIPPSWINGVNQTPSQQAILRSLHHNLHLQMTYFSYFSPNIRNIPQPGDVTVIQSDLLDDTYNIVLDTHFAPNLVWKRIKEVLNMFIDIPFSWWVGPNDKPENLKECLQKEGLKKTEENKCMYAFIKKIKNRSLELDGLEFKQATTQKELELFFTIMTSIGMNPNIYTSLFHELPIGVFANNAPLEFHIGYLKGIAVVTGMLVYHAGVAGIYYIATKPEYRKQGCATAIMYHLLNKAYSLGYPLATLTASIEGEFVYKKIGFETLGTYCEFK